MGRRRKQCPVTLERNFGSGTSVDYCAARKGHTGPHFAPLTRVAWVLDYGMVPYDPDAAVRVMRGGHWLAKPWETTDAERLRERLVDAMQDAWDEFVADTGCIPDCFHIRGPRSTRMEADFGKGKFAEWVAERLLAPRKDDDDA